MTGNEPVILEFIWIDGHSHLRSKYKTVYHTITAKEDILDIEQWNYDGSSTFQAETSDSEIVLNPVKYCPNPFITEYKSYIVLYIKTFLIFYLLSGTLSLYCSRYFTRKMCEVLGFLILQGYFLPFGNVILH